MKYIILLLSVFFTAISSTVSAQNLEVAVALEYITDTTFKLTFSEDIELSEASNVSNYTFSGTAGMVGNPVSAAASGSEVILKIPGDIRQFLANESVVVAVSGITALSGNTLDTDKSVGKYFVWHFYEDLQNSDLEAAYTSKTYTGNHNVVWSYNNSRNEPSGGIMLRFNAGSSLINTSNLSNGIASLSFEHYKNWSNTDDRKVTASINDELSYEVEYAVGSGSPAIHVFSQENINSLGVDGKTSLKISNTTNSNQNIVVHNIRWTSYAPAHPIDMEFISSNQIALYFDQIIDETTVNAAAFAISLGGVSGVVSTAEYSQGNKVLLTIEESLSDLDNNDLIEITVNNVANYFNSLAINNFVITTVFEKPEVVPALEYVDFTTVKLFFTSEINTSDAVTLTNYTLDGTGGATGNPSAISLENDTTVVLTVPSTGNYNTGETLNITVTNVFSNNGISEITPPNNVASIVIDREAPSVLASLEFVDMETFRVAFSEPVLASTNSTDYVFSGTAGLPLNPILVNPIDATTLEIKVLDMTAIFTHDNTVILTVSNVFDHANNPIDPSANTALYSMDTSTPTLNLIGIENIEHRSANVKLTVDKRAVVFWSVFEEDSEEPEIIDIINENGLRNGTNDVLIADEEISLFVDELVWKTGYDIFLVAQSREGIYSELKSLTFTTTGESESFSEEELSNYNGCIVHSSQGKVIISRDKETTVENKPLDVYIYTFNGSLVYSSKLSPTDSKLASPQLAKGLYIVITVDKDGKKQVNKTIVY